MDTKTPIKTNVMPRNGILTCPNSITDEHKLKFPNNHSRALQKNKGSRLALFCTHKNVRLQVGHRRGKKGTVSIVTVFRLSGFLRSVSVF